jgi:hypothetical protein
MMMPNDPKLASGLHRLGFFGTLTIWQLSSRHRQFAGDELTEK